MRQATGEADRVIRAVLRRQGGLISRNQLLAAGWTPAALRYRTRVEGPWQAVLPGIYHDHNGPLAGGQREIAAILYAGEECVISGQAALFQHGVRAPLTDFVDVLIPHSKKLQSIEFVRIVRTKRMPERPWLRDGIRWAPVARAVADATRGQLGSREVTAIVADAIQRQRCTISQLAQELRAGPNRGSALLRSALEEVADGVASVAEGDLRKLVKTAGLPEPLYNPKLYVGSEFLAQPDLWWRDAGVTGEVDSREWHLSPELWARTMARHTRMTAQGILVLHFTPKQIRQDGIRVVAELRAALAAGRQRPALPIRTFPT
jgi:hypothetical protein